MGLLALPGLVVLHADHDRDGRSDHPGEQLGTGQRGLPGEGGPDGAVPARGHAARAGGNRAHRRTPAAICGSAGRRRPRPVRRGEAGHPAARARKKFRTVGLMRWPGRPWAGITSKTSGADDRDVVTEHGLRLSSGGWQVRNSAGHIEAVYPLARWIEHERRHGAVYRRRIIVVDDWAEVGEDQAGELMAD